MTFLPPWPIPPGVILLVGALVLLLVRGAARKVLLVAAPALTVMQVLSLADVDFGLAFRWMDIDVQLLHVDRLRLLFGLIFAIMALIGSLFALHVDDLKQHVAAWVYAGGALGVTFAGDFLGFVLFWELMAVASSILVFARPTPSARAAGLRYLAVHGVGGSLLLMGAVALYEQTGSLELRALHPDLGMAAWLVLIGVAVNAAIPPLGAWLPDAYGEGTVTGSVFLSAYTTKTAVFALLALFPGWEVLLWAGVVMALYGVVYAVLENNIRRLLAYHIISQVGYMVAAAGMGTPLALDGGGAHAFSHILYKSLLFMGAGSVLYATGKEKLTELGGIARAMPWALGLYAVGAASISGFPLFNGFVSKSIVVTAAGQGGWPAAELCLTVASIGTFLHTGLKLLWFTFVWPVDRKHAALKPLPWNMYAAMGLGAFLCTLIGVWPHLLYARLPFHSEYHPYTVHHVVQSVQLLVMTALAFWLMFDKLHGEATVSLDTDWFYRRPLRRAVMALSRGLFAAQTRFGEAVARAVTWGLVVLHHPHRYVERLLGRGMLRDPGALTPEPQDDDPYRLPVGITVLAMLALFVMVALWHVMSRRLGT